MASITVVIPLYNKAPHIVKTLESVLAQSSRPKEIIVVDDGSTDGGSDLVAPYVERYGVRLIRQENAGVSVARNRGVSEANSDYVAFLDADDYWLPQHIEVLRKLIVSYPRAALFSTALFMECGGSRYRLRPSYENGWMGLVDDFFVRYANDLSLITSITACARKCDLLEVGGFPVGVRRGEDIICWINMGLKFPVAHAEIVTAVYYQDAVNRTNHLREAEPPGSLRHIAELLKNKKLRKDQQKGLTTLFDRIAVYEASERKANDDVEGLKAIHRLALLVSRHRIVVMTTVLMWMPRELIQWMKKIRRHLREKYAK